MACPTQSSSTPTCTSTARRSRSAKASTVSVDVPNTSNRAADEVVQLYIHQRHGTSSRPVRELKGFVRVALEPGEAQTLTFPLGPEQLRYWSAATRDHVQDATTVDIWVGGDSTAELSTTLRIAD